MVWQLEFDPKAEREFSRLDKSVQRTIKKFLAEVCELKDPASRGHPLSNILAGQHTYRIGQLRIIVRIQRQIVTVTVLKMERRDSAYKSRGQQRHCVQWQRWALKSSDSGSQCFINC